MGDIVHLIPTFAVLRRRFPDEPLALLCQRPFGAVLPPSLGVELIELPARADFAAMLQVLRRIRRRGFSRLLDFFGNPRTAIISAFSGIPLRIGFDYRIRRAAYHRCFHPADPNRHLASLFGEFLEFAGLGGLELPAPWLEWKPEDDLRAGAILAGETPKMRGQALRPLLGVNPHATYPSKAWPHEHFVEVIRRWGKETGGRALVFSGPGEEAATDRIISEVGPENAFSHPALRLPELFALMSKVDLFLTGDTGPMNLAWALGLPIVALFGPTTRRAVEPKGPDNLILHHPTLDCLECHKETCVDGRCMSELVPEWVFNRIRERYPRFFSIPGMKNQ